MQSVSMAAQSHNPEQQAQPRCCVFLHSLVRGFALFDVRVLDHIIIGDGEPLSMAEQGWVVA